MILSPVEQSIKRKIESIGTPLKDWNIKIYRGILTGYNEAFIIDRKKKDELISADPKSAEIIRPILRGRDIKRYGFDFADLWLINTHNGIKDKGIPPVDINRYPAVKAHLDKYWDKISVRNDKGDTPYNLRNCVYTDDFSKQKIVWGNLCLSAQYAWVEDEMYVNAPSPFITNANKYILALLNSKVVDWYIKMLGVSRNGGYYEYKPMFVEMAPIPHPSSNIQLEIETLVDKLLSAKMNKRDFSSYEKQIDGIVFSIYGISEIEKSFLNHTSKIEDNSSLVNG